MGYELLFVVLDLRQIDTISMKGVKNALLTKNHTVWNLTDFSVTQILREINFGESRSCKTAIFQF